MLRATPSLLSRLRRHRGLWVLIAVALVLKLAAGTICLADRAYPGDSFKNLAASGSSMSVDMPSDQTATDENAVCVLGEAGDCHCACAHTLPLPAVASLSVARMETHFKSSAIHSGFEPAIVGSLLRPPIA